MNSSGTLPQTQSRSLLARQSFRTAQRTVLLATMFCYFFYYTGRHAFGFAIPGIEEELGLSKATLGWVSAALLWCYALGQIPNGYLGDRVGGRIMMSTGACLSCGLNWIVSLANGFWGLLVPWGMNGLAQSMGWAPGSRVLSNWWPSNERGRTYGWYVFAAGMGTVLAFVTSILVLEVLDLNWRWIFRLPILLLLVGGVTYYLIVRDRPEQAGFEPHSDSDAPESKPGNADENENAWESYREVLSHGRFLVASWAIGFQSIARYGLLIWVPVHFLGSDWKQEGRSWISVALPVGMALGALTSGWLSDRMFGSRRTPVIALFMALAAAFSVAMYFIPKEQVTLGLIVLFLCGFFVYGPQSAFWALCPDLLGVKRTGTGTGIMNFHAYLFAGLGEPFIGWMIDSSESLDGRPQTGIIFLVVAVACMASASISLFIKR